jgi:hypothetical protein
MSTPPPDSKSTAPTPKAARRGWAIAALVVLFGIHTFQAVRLFPTPASIVEPGSPVVMVDHAIHEYHGALGARFFRESGTTWGYDPYFMAGYPETPVWDSSSNPSILFDLIGGGHDYRAYKVGLLVCSILLLAAIAGGAWAAGLGATEVAVASTIAWFYFWVGFPAALWRTGLFAFVTACAGVGLLLGLCSRFDRSPTRGNWLLLTVVGAALFFTHVTAPILAIGGLLAFYATVGRRHGWRWHAAIVGAGALAVAANLVWLVPLWQFRELRVGAGYFMTANSAWFLFNYFLDPSIETRTALKLLILGLVGLVVWWFGGRRGSAAAFGGSIVALIVLTGFGSFWGPTRVMEPLRFRVGFLLLLACPAGSAVVGTTRLIARWAGGGGRGRLAASLAWVALLGAWGTAERSLLRGYWAYVSMPWSLVVGVGPEMRELVGWLRGNTDLSARILFEDQLRLLEFTDPESTHWTPLLPQLLEPDSRMFVGGLYHMAFIKNHKLASFGDFHLGDRPIDDWSPAEVEAYCRTYNVGWVVCWSPLSRFWFDRYPAAVKVATLPRYSTPGRPPSNNQHEWEAMARRAGPDVAMRYMFEGERSYSIYRVQRPRSYFLKGKGRISAVGPNRVELADLEPEGGAVVVSLHWIDSWKADPPRTLRPEPVPNDPVAFVRIELPGPVDRLVLTNVPGHRQEEDRPARP